MVKYYIFYLFIVILVQYVYIGNAVTVDLYMNKYGINVTSIGSMQTTESNSCDDNLVNKCIIGTTNSLNGDSIGFRVTGSTSNLLTTNNVKFLEFYFKVVSQNNPEVYVTIGSGAGSTSKAVLNGDTAYLNPLNFTNGYAQARIYIYRLNVQDGTSFNDIYIYSSNVSTVYLSSVLLTSDPTSSVPLGYPQSPKSSTSSTPSKSNGGAIAAGILIPLIVIAAIIAFIVYRRKQKKKRSNYVSNLYDNQTVQSNKSGMEMGPVQNQNESNPTPKPMVPAPKSNATQPFNENNGNGKNKNNSNNNSLDDPSKPRPYKSTPNPQPIKPVDFTLTLAPTVQASSPPPELPPKPVVTPNNTTTITKSTLDTTPNVPSKPITPSSSVPKSSLVITPSVAPSKPIPKRNNTINRVFGESIYQGVLLDGQMVPFVVKNTVDYLSYRGLNEVGILRQAGSKKEVDAIVDRYNKGETSIDFSEFDLFAVGDVLKKYLRELPSSLIPNLSRESISNIDKVLDEQDYQQQSSMAQALINSLGLDQIQRSTLAYLFTYLSKVVQNSAINKMNSSNISLVFSPTLQFPPDLIDLLIKHPHIL